ncbi:MAG TPA: EVE domain-containing protein [Candidatus Polarisedimenticolia bacterium]|jgi:predicted RNA-binding protein with PUA-like domain
MSRWLFKTEPGEYSWDDLVRERRAVWDGVTNPLALIHLRATAKGEEVLIYHTGGERRAVGIARIAKGPHPDPSLEDPKLVVVEIAPVRPLSSAVTLETIKADAAFAGWDLLRLGRLSIVPVPRPMWDRILRLSATR